MARTAAELTAIRDKVVNELIPALDGELAAAGAVAQALSNQSQAATLVETKAEEVVALVNPPV